MTDTTKAPFPTEHAQALSGAVSEPIKDHIIAQTVNQLRMVALKYGESQQLRDRIAEVIVPLLKPSAQSPGIDAVKVRDLIEALKFYADQSHFHMHDDTAWDTVSGEPINFYEDESNTATVEDGSIAKLALEAYESPPLPSQPEPLGQAMSDEEILKLVCDNTGKRISLPNFTLDELKTFARGLLRKTGASGLDILPLK